ncbi:MAG: hypothetical protein NTV23_06700 [Propionibacteriales bacterium]|nr:hypothetical protein [Propionibacteriales bacterium]
MPDYTRLPAPVRLEDTVAEVETRPVPDPEGGTNPETAFLIRNAG